MFAKSVLGRLRPLYLSHISTWKCSNLSCCCMPTLHVDSNGGYRWVVWGTTLGSKFRDLNCFVKTKFYLGLFEKVKGLSYLAHRPVYCLSSISPEKNAIKKL